MPTEPVTRIGSISSLESGVSGPGRSSAATLDSFGQILGDAINSINEKENNANNAIARLAAGDDVELHQVMMATQEADIALHLALQVRNKVVEAYQDVMRMQV
jgi:flagellar hook-basal body complex protein FliE